MNRAWICNETPATRRARRKPKLNAQQVREIKGLMSDPSIPVSQIVKRYDESRTTIYKVAPVRQQNYNI